MIQNEASFSFYVVFMTSDGCVALAVPMIQRLETTLRAGAVPQVPQFNPSAVAQPTPSANGNLNRSSDSGSGSSINEVEKNPKSEEQPRKADAKTVAPAVVKERTAVNDPLGDARSRVQEEISTEFAAIMATGTLRASEAAALATKRVMQRYGHMNLATSQS